MRDLIRVLLGASINGPGLPARQKRGAKRNFRQGLTEILLRTNKQPSMFGQKADEWSLLLFGRQVKFGYFEKPTGEDTKRPSFLGSKRGGATGL
jgi:hypothetical protein